MPQSPTLHWTMNVDGDFASELDSALDKELMDEGMRMFAEKVKEVWTERVEQTLHNTKDEYLKGLNIEVTDEGVSVTLSGKLAVALEQGTKFDMKPGFLGSAQKRVIHSDRFTKPNDKGVVSPFRTVTNDPKQDQMWWYPEKEGKKIATQVEQELPRIRKEVFDVLLSRIKI